MINSKKDIYKWIALGSGIVTLLSGVASLTCFFGFARDKTTTVKWSFNAATGAKDENSIPKNNLVTAINDFEVARNDAISKGSTEEEASIIAIENSWIMSETLWKNYEPYYSNEWVRPMKLNSEGFTEPDPKPEIVNIDYQFKTDNPFLINFLTIEVDIGVSINNILKVNNVKLDWSMSTVFGNKNTFPGGKKDAFGPFCEYLAKEIKESIENYANIGDGFSNIYDLSLNSTKKDLDSKSEQLDKVLKDLEELNKQASERIDELGLSKYNDQKEVDKYCSQFNSSPGILFFKGTKASEAAGTPKGEIINDAKKWKDRSAEMIKFIKDYNFNKDYDYIQTQEEFFNKMKSTNSLFYAVIGTAILGVVGLVFIVIFFVMFVYLKNREEYGKEDQLDYLLL